MLMPAVLGQQRLTVIPLVLADACAVVDRYHRHHRRPLGHRFSLGVLGEDGALHGAAIVGRPVARALDTGWQVEVTRVATDGTPNACSALYGAAARVATAAGFQRVLTYTQSGESGASLRGAGWTQVAVLRPRTGWDTPSRHRADRGTDGVARILWERACRNAPPLPPLNALRDEIRDVMRCLECPNPIPRRTGPGRPSRYCSPACRQRGYRTRQRAGHE
ncbi:XF1762 family protein [Streptacidiphilus sp. N1-12]|uniref:XF1762 family protein n=2 Tax=Streptacidiphilus alkalitolerans TaxID=3342712 RepID=A0ABV6WCK5_9ACTN